MTEQKTVYIRKPVTWSDSSINAYALISETLSTHSPNDFTLCIHLINFRCYSETDRLDEQINIHLTQNNLDWRISSFDVVWDPGCHFYVTILYCRSIEFVDLALGTV